MGANFDHDVIPDHELKMTDKEIERQAEAIFEKAAYMNGHGGYTGSLAEKTSEGVSIHRDIVFNSIDEAYKHVQDNLDSDKWGPADVVPVKGQGWFVGGNCSS